MSKVIVLVQARMGSSRFPGKMLASLGQYRLLEWVLHRVRCTSLIDGVVLATSSLSQDDELVKIASQMGIEAFRGSETNVLERYSLAASKYKADIIVRVCADNPFIDPNEIERLIIHFKKNQYDYACNHQDRLGSRYADGFGAEIFSNALLQEIGEIAEEPRYREHVTIFIWENIHLYTISALRAPVELAYPALRFDVDTKQDLFYLQQLVNRGVSINSSAAKIVEIALAYQVPTLVTTDHALCTDSRQDNKYFLGAWCFKSISEQKDAIASGRVLDYHWNCRHKLRSDYTRLGQLNDQLIAELTPILNELHNVNEGKSYWRFLLGYWLNIYTTVIFDRWSSIQEALSVSYNWQTVVLPLDDELLATFDTADFILKATESSIWNHNLYATICAEYPAINIVVSGRTAAACKGGYTISSSMLMLSTKAKQLLLKIYAAIADCLKASDQVFLLNTYLPQLNLAKLEIALGQIPFPRYSPRVNIRTNYDCKLRKWRMPVTPQSDQFESIARRLLPKLMPRIFLEGFQSLNICADRLSWPQKPEVIFTSQDHYTNETFKVWSAKKCKKGANLIIGEHGSLGVGLFNATHRYEVSIADTYLTTGWTSNFERHIRPLGHFRKKLEEPSFTSSSKGLLICCNMPRFAFDIRSTVIAGQMLDYFEEQFSFVDFLPHNVKRQLLVRLYPHDYGWLQADRWLDRHPEIDIAKPNKPIYKLSAICRLFITSYNSTTYIDSLASNYPTVIFWNPERWEIKPEAYPHFEKLKQCGIFHETPQDAAIHVASIWQDIPSWWQSEKVQRARIYFCERYANTDLKTNIGIMNIIAKYKAKRF
jgi:putative transferase (TIGR04331 family)